MVNKIKSVRLEKNVSQKELAEKLGVSAAEVCRWEVGTNMPRIQILLKIASVLSCHVEDLVSLEKEEIDENVNVDKCANQFTHLSSDVKKTKKLTKVKTLADDWED